MDNETVGHVFLSFLPVVVDKVQLSIDLNGDLIELSRHRDLPQDGIGQLLEVDVPVRRRLIGTDQALVELILRSLQLSDPLVDDVSLSIQLEDNVLPAGPLPLEGRVIRPVGEVAVPDGREQHVMTDSPVSLTPLHILIARHRSGVGEASAGKLQQTG